MPPESQILYCGPTDGTCLQRARALEELGHAVEHVRSGIPVPTDWSYPVLRVANRLRPHPDLYQANRRLLSLARERAFDLVWIDKGLQIRPETVVRLRELLPGAAFVTYSPDDMTNPANQSEKWLGAVGYYDLHVTTKSHNVAPLRSMGARSVLYVDNAYDPQLHRPMRLSEQERARFASEVGFVGIFQPDREERVRHLAESGIRTTVWGPGWAHLADVHPNLRVTGEFLDDEDYARCLSATDINLGFLRKDMKDQQTTRSTEIPACGAFLLAERTADHQRLFDEGREAEFFGDDRELAEKCAYYLAHPDERRRIAAAGRERCVTGGYSNQGRIAQILEHVGSFGAAPQPLAA